MKFPLEISRYIPVPPTAAELAANPCQTCGTSTPCSVATGWCGPCLDSIYADIDAQLDSPGEAY